MQDMPLQTMPQEGTALCQASVYSACRVWLDVLLTLHGIWQPSHPTCHSLTSFSSGLEWMWVLATQTSWRREPPPPAPLSANGGSSASSTAISATLSCGGMPQTASVCEKSWQTWQMAVSAP